jgi:Asp-tRNA(Asn)/Glu-tRNA(Gln) amidotransferase A subunit family amidase
MNVTPTTQLFAGIILGASLIGALWYVSETGINVKTVAAAEKLIGLEYSDEQREKLTGRLEQSLENFEQVRNLEIPNNSHLPLYFDPTPPGKVFDFEPQIPIYWDIPTGVELPVNRSELAFYSIKELASLIKHRKITSVELTEFFLERLEQYDDKLEAVVTITRKRALEQARNMDEELQDGNHRGILHGIPYGAKDLFAVEGYKTTWGATPYKDQVIDQTATVIRKMDESGAVLIAKLTLGALAYGDIWFDGRTNNPWNPEQGSSGSSAGSAAATVAGLVPFALGTETLGSIVSPSTRTGATGLRPTFGQVSRHGAMALSWTMDKVGPLTRSVEDAAIVYHAIRGPDGYDLTVKNYPFNFTGNVDFGELRIGYYKDAFEASPNGAYYDSLSLELLRGMAGELIPVELPDLPLGGMFNLLTAEGAAAFDELTLTGRDRLLVWQDDNAWPNLFRTVRFLPAVEWIQLNRVRAMLIDQMDKVMEEVELFITPTFGGNNLLITNLTGHPAVVMPNGFSVDVEPVSITFIGSLYDEATLLAVADKFQKETDFHLRRPPLFAAD